MSMCMSSAAFHCIDLCIMSINLNMNRFLSDPIVYHHIDQTLQIVNRRPLGRLND